MNLLTEHLAIWTGADNEKKSGRGRASGSAASVYGVKKLRELILELAVRGKLVPQDASDEPASELLKRIEAEKAKLIKEGKIKAQKPLAEIGDNEKLFELPKGWVLTRLDSIAFSQAGFAFKSNGFNEHGLGLPLIRIRDVGQNFTGTYFEGEYRDEFVVIQGDYLISMDGEFRVAKWLNKNALLNQRVSRLVFFGSEIAKAFIAESLQARLRELQGVKAYTTVDHLSGGQISNSIIPLPPLAEQHRIVAKVDELMTLCDQLENQHSNAIVAHEKLVSYLLNTLTQSQNTAEFNESWQRIAANFDTLFSTESSIDALKQTVLQLAVMGKLVPQDVNDEPASELLKRIQAEKAKLIAEGKIKKDKPLAVIGNDEKPFELPNGWEWVSFGFISEFINGDRGKNYPNRDEYVEKGMPWINTGHIEPDGTLSICDMNYITKEKFDILNGGKIESDDLVYCLRGATFGKTAFVLPYREGAVASSLMIIRPYLSDLRFFIYKYLISPFGKSQVYRFNNGSAQPNLSSGSVGLYAFPIPPLAEQHRIVAKVDELMAICDQLKTRITTANQLQQKLADVMVAWAVA